MNLTLRREVLDTLRTSCSQVRVGRYWVKRGAIVWAAFPFDLHPYAISIVVSESDVVTKPSVMTVTLEFAARMPGPGDDPGQDDGLTEEMFEDAQQILAELVAKTRANGEPVGERLVTKFITKGDDRPQAIEFSHSTTLVQGLIVVFEVGF